MGIVVDFFSLLQDPRFNAEVDQITGYKTQSILCLPIKNHRDEVRDEFKQKMSELLYNICNMYYSNLTATSY